MGNWGPGNRRQPGKWEGLWAEEQRGRGLRNRVGRDMTMAISRALLLI